MLFAAATLVPAFATACAAAGNVTGAGPSGNSPAPTGSVRPKEVKEGDTWLCDQRYALCTSAACEPSPSDPGIVICRCEVQDGYSAGLTSCAERSPVGDRLFSAFSVQNATSRTHAMTCPTRARWGNCLGVVCQIDPHNPQQALCQCMSVESENFLTFGGNCDTRTCTTVIWSAGDPAVAGRGRAPERDEEHRSSGHLSRGVSQWCAAVVTPGRGQVTGGARGHRQRSAAELCRLGLLAGLLCDRRPGHAAAPPNPATKRSGCRCS